MAGYEVGSAFLTIMPSAKGFASSLAGELDGPFDAAGRRGGQRIGDGIDQGGRRGVAAAGGSLGKIFVGAFAAIGAANIVSSVVGFFNEAVSVASDLAETQSKAGEIFGEATDTIIEKSREAASTLGQSQQVYLDGASTFGIFGQAAGLAGNDLATFSTDMVTLATDLASFNNTSPEQAIQAIGAALRGESEPIRAYGVLLDDATLKQRAMTMGIYDGEGALTAQQRTLAAQAEILAQTSTQQGDFARTSEGLANQQRILEAELANVKTEIGTALLPVVTELFGVFKDIGVPALQDLAAWFTENKATVMAFAFGTVDAGLMILETFLAIMENQQELLNFWLGVVDAMLDAWFTVVGGVIDGAVKMFGWVPGVGDKLRGVQESFGTLRTDAETKMSAIRAASENAVDMWGQGRSAVQGLRQDINSLADRTIRLTVIEEVRRKGGGVVDGYYVTPTTPLPGRAGGGPVSAGRPYMVGEYEPELFVPDRSGVIYNQRQLAAMAGAGGGSGVTQNNYFSPGFDEEAAADAAARRLDWELRR